jgi:hypothetical protein
VTSEESGVRGQKDAETRKSKLAAGTVTPAKAGVAEVVDSRLRGNDPLSGFRFSNFEFRFCLLTSNF